MREVEAAAAPGVDEIKARLRVMIGYDAKHAEVLQVAALLLNLTPLAVDDPILAEPATTYCATAGAVI